MNKLKEKIKQKIKEYKDRKKVEGKPNIEGVTSPKKRAPKKVEAPKGSSKHAPGSVSIGAHGGRYVQEPSGHKRYISEGSLSGTSKYKKSKE